MQNANSVEAAIDEHPEGKGMEELIHIIYNRHAEGDWCNDGDLDQHDLDSNEIRWQTLEVH